MKNWHIVAFSLVMFVAGFIAGRIGNMSILNSVLLGLLPFACYWFAFLSRICER